MTAWWIRFRASPFWCFLLLPLLVIFGTIMTVVLLFYGIAWLFEWVANWPWPDMRRNSGSAF